MMMNFISPTFYPTTVVFLDDNKRLFRHLVEALQLKKSPHKTFTDPRQCLTFLNQETYRQTFVQTLMGADETTQGDSLSFTPTSLIKDLHTLNRYHQVSVLVVDYEMPGMNGLDVCAQMQNPHIKKIMLTGEADETIAVKAFNQGQIDAYIRKHDPNFISLLQGALEKAQQDYFAELFQMPLEVLAKRAESTALVDPVFIEYFQGLCQKHGIQEYYLMEAMGSFLMIDKRKKYHSLMTWDGDLIQVYLDSAIMDTVSPEKEAAIVRKDLMPCYYAPFSGSPFEPAGSLEPYLHKPHILKGASKTYYTQFGKGFIQAEPDHIALWN